MCIMIPDWPLDLVPTLAVGRDFSESVLQKSDGEAFTCTLWSKLSCLLYYPLDHLENLFIPITYYAVIHLSL